MARRTIVPVGRLSVATPATMALAVRNNTIATDAVDERVQSVAADVIANDPTIIAAAENAVDDALTDAQIVRFPDPAIPNVQSRDGGVVFGITDSAHRISEISIGPDGRFPQWVVDSIGTRMGAGTASGWDIIVGAGQSNMTPRGNPITTLRDPDPRLYQWSATEGIIPVAAEDMWVLSEFGREYLRRVAPTGRRVLLVNVAAGGTGFTTTSLDPAPAGYKTQNGTWDRTLSDPVSYYDRMLDRVSDALDAAGTDARIACVLWSQGEADSNADNPPYLSRTEYEAKLDDLIGAVRGAWGVPDLPFLVGSMVPEWYEGEPTRMAVARGLAETPLRVQRTGFAWGPSGMAEPVNVVHWNSHGHILRAGPFIDAYMEARANATGTEVSAPANLRARRSGDTVTVEWDRPLCHVDSLTVEYSTNGGSSWSSANVDTAHGSRATFTASGAALVRARITSGSNSSIFTTTSI